MTLIGKYVSTFAEATHALPDGMHMNADYPFKLPSIEKIEGKSITIASGGKTATAKIKRDANGEFFELAQSSTYEHMFRRRPQKFRFEPFLRTERA